MTYYNDIYEYAADNFGLITSAQAKNMGIPSIELVKLAHRGRLTRIGQGVYRIHHYIPTEFDGFAAAVALVGDGAYVYGISVLAMFNLALVNPRKTTIATPVKVRRKLLPYIEVVPARSDTEVTQYEGIPSQSVADAFRTCRRSVMTERLLPAIEDARLQGLVTEKEAKELTEEIESGRKSPTK